MKKIIKTLLVVMVVVLALTAFVACNEENQCDHKCTQEFVAGYDATCTEDGLRPGFKCPECGEMSKEQTVIEAYGHDMADATCTTPATCMRGDCTHTEGEALGHSYTVDVDAQAATCEAIGWSAHKTCERCGKANEEYVEESALGHDWCDPFTYYPATCTENGLLAVQCQREECGVKKGYAYIDATGHKTGDDGVCTGCGYLVVDTVDELVAALAVANNKILVLEGTYAVVTNATYNTFCPAAGVELVGEGEVVLEGTLRGTLENVTIKNLTITGGNSMRYAYAKGECTFEGVTFNATSVYAIHFDGITEGTNVLFKDCEIIGWVAMSGSPASMTFDGCTVKGNGTYGLIRTYFDATIKNCTFDVSNVNTEDIYQDGIHATRGATITVENCTNANGEMADIAHSTKGGFVVIGDVTVHDHYDTNADAKCDTCEKYFLPEVGTAFVLKMYHGGLYKTVYFNGTKGDYYYNIGDYNSAAALYLEAVEGGYYMYMGTDTKTYINLVVTTDGYVNAGLSETASTVWVWNEELGLLTTYVEVAANTGKTGNYYLGTYGTKNDLRPVQLEKNPDNYKVYAVVVPEHTCDGESTCSKLAVCSICGLEHGELKDHEYDMTNGAVTAPTCVKDGYITYTCSCGATTTAAGEAATGSHTFENCVCTVCGEEDTHTYTDGRCTCGAYEPVTVQQTIETYADANGWTNGTAYNDLIMDTNVTVTAVDTVGNYHNTAKYYTSGENWRMYQNESPTITVKAAEGMEIVSVKITYDVGNTGVLTLDDANIASGIEVSVNANSVVFGVGNTGTATNGQVKITSIEVVYRQVNTAE